MLLGPLKTLRPGFASTLGAAELPGENEVESLNLLLSPFDAGAHHWGREAALEAFDRVMDDHEVDEGELPNIQVQVPLENALPRNLSAAPS